MKPKFRLIPPAADIIRVPNPNTCGAPATSSIVIRMPAKSVAGTGQVPHPVKVTKEFSAQVSATAFITPSRSPAGTALGLTQHTGISVVPSED
ncbi:MAG: hypothetical protein KAH20_10960 [Methylococcales bacterium]|nr:hypothetical protein [Methylococcales bacterium]